MVTWVVKGDCRDQFMSAACWSNIFPGIILHLEDYELCATGTIPYFIFLKPIFPSISGSTNVVCPLGYKHVGTI